MALLCRSWSSTRLLFFPHFTLPTQPCRFAPFPQQRFPEPIPSTGQALLSNHHSPSESPPHVDCSLWVVNTEVMALSNIHQGSLGAVLNQGDDVDEVGMNQLWVPVPHRCFRDGPLMYVATSQIWAQRWPVIPNVPECIHKCLLCTWVSTKPPEDLLSFLSCGDLQTS